MASTQSLDWLDENHEFGENYTIQSLRELLETADSVEEECKNMIQNVREAKKRVLQELVNRTDADAMGAAPSTPQAIAFRSLESKNKMLDLQSIQFRSLFFDPKIPVSEEVRREVRGYLHRTFPSVSAWAIERAVLANRGHLAGSHIMIEAWLKGGCPERFHYRVMGSVREMDYRMAWPYEKDNHAYSTTRRRSEGMSPSRKSEMSLPLSPSMLIELQYLQARDEWLKARKEDRSQAELETSGSFQELDKSFVTELQKEMNKEMTNYQQNDNYEETSQDMELKRKLEEDFNETQLPGHLHDLSKISDANEDEEVEVEECPDQSGLFVPRGESTMKSFGSPPSDQNEAEDQDNSTIEEVEHENDIGFMMKSNEETDLSSVNEEAEVMQSELIHLLNDAVTPLASVFAYGGGTEDNFEDDDNPEDF